MRFPCFMIYMNLQELKNLSKLAMITMNDGEMRDFEKDAKKIRAMADELAMLDLDKQSPTASKSLNDLRDDEPFEYRDTLSLIKCAPESDGAFIVAPLILRED